MIKILVVEDDPDLSNIIRVHLRRAGYVPTAAYSSAEAAQLLDHESFDLVILDVVLPDKRGVELCAQVRKKIAMPHYLHQLPGRQPDHHPSAAVRWR